MAFDDRTNTQINGPKIHVNASWNGATTLITRRGADSARFFGYNSPTIIERTVAAVIAVTTLTMGAAPAGRPHERKTGSMSAEIAGSIVHPVRRVVRVIPNCADDRCVEVRVRALIPAENPFSPAARRASRSLRSRMTRANSEATKNPVPTVRITPMRMYTHSVTRHRRCQPVRVTANYGHRPCPHLIVRNARHAGTRPIGQWVG